jgi:antitoxin CptB
MPDEGFMNSEDSVSEEDLARLRYRCRRGLLELDTLLARFIDSPQFKKLSPAQYQTFEKLLNETDPQLLRWLTKQEPCEIEEYQVFIQFLSL